MEFPSIFHLVLLWKMKVSGSVDRWVGSGYNEVGCVWGGVGRRNDEKGDEGVGMGGVSENE